MSEQRPSHERAIKTWEARIGDLERLIEKGKAAVQTWTDAARDVSQSAAEARAKNQAMGRGLGGAFFGAKYRSAMRRAAASSNADIAREVAEKRAQIRDGKRKAQEHVKALRAELSEAKRRLREVKSHARTRRSTRKKAAQAADESLVLLKKLKEAHDLGVLTDQEFEEKRRKLVQLI